VTLSDALSNETGDQSRTAALGRIADLLDRNGIDLAEIGAITKVNLWQGFSKDQETGENNVVDLVGVQIAPAWAEGPQWPVVQQAAPTLIRPKPRKSATSGTVIAILPDPQIGYRRNETGDLDPFHDEHAIDVALQIVADAKPHRIINLGDSCDFAEWSSKFTISPEMVLTTQPTIDRLHRFIAEQIAAAPDDCQITLMEGNHDARLPLAITKNAMAALRLRRANTPDSWPVLSMPHLLRLDDFGQLANGQPRATYIAGYPAARIKLAAGNDTITPLFAVHGERLTVSAVAKNERQSFVQGHIHRIQDHWATFDVDGQPIIVNAWSPGCLCRIDGAVPSTRGATDPRGVPIRRIEDWQQGCAIITVSDDGSWSKELVPITNGNATWRGRTYQSRHG
jgi:hypothetical protein